MAYVTDMLKGLCGAEQRWIDLCESIDDRPKKPQPTVEEFIDKFNDWLNGGDES